MFSNRELQISNIQYSDFNAVRSGDADRFTNEATTADLSACEAPDNVGLRIEKEEAPLSCGHLPKGERGER
jgi:hypothetical protein